jgi:hypothetical protein
MVSTAFKKSGKSNVASTTPELLVNSTYNHFSLNKPALELLGAMSTGASIKDNEKGYIKLWDVGTEDNGFRFFVSTGFYNVHDEEGNKHEPELFGAKIGGKGAITASPFWGAILASNPALPDGAMEVGEINKDDMKRKGIMHDVGSSTYTGKFLVKPAYVDEDGEITLEDTGVTATLSTFGDPEKPIETVKGKPVDLQLFALVDIVFKEYTPTRKLNALAKATGETHEYTSDVEEVTAAEMV